MDDLREEINLLNKVAGMLAVKAHYKKAHTIQKLIQNFENGGNGEDIINISNNVGTVSIASGNSCINVNNNKK